MSQADLLAFVREYQEALNDLKAPVKSSIMALTMLAAENKGAASSVAAVVENHLITCPPERRLPAIYLLDSIAKNARDPYVPLFARNLPQVFSTAWDGADAKTQASLERLLATWSGVFPDAALAAIQDRMSAQRQQAWVGAPQLASAYEHPPPPPAPTAYAPPPPAMGYGAPPPGFTPPPGTMAPPVAAVYPNSSGYGAPVYGGYGGGAPPPPVYNYAPPPPPQQQQLAPAPEPAVPPADLSQLLSLLHNVQAAVQPAAPAAAAAAPASRHAPGVFDAARLKEFDPAPLQALAAKSLACRSRHLDRLFLHRQRLKHSAAAHDSRRWYVDVDTWAAGTADAQAPPVPAAQEDGGAPAVSYSVPLDDERTHCALSGERFETYWDTAHQQWRYRNALRLEGDDAARMGLPDGSLVLASCIGGGGATAATTAAVVPADAAPVGNSGVDAKPKLQADAGGAGVLPPLDTKAAGSVVASAAAVAGAAAAGQPLGAAAVGKRPADSEGGVEASDGKRIKLEPS